MLLTRGHRFSYSSTSGTAPQKRSISKIHLKVRTPRATIVSRASHYGTGHCRSALRGHAAAVRAYAPVRSILGARVLLDQSERGERTEDRCGTLRLLRADCVSGRSPWGWANTVVVSHSGHRYSAARRPDSTCRSGRWTRACPSPS